MSQQLSVAADSPTRIREIRFAEHGAPEVLDVAEMREIPEPGPGQVLLRVKAVGVNPLDAKIRSGVLAAVFPVTFPHVPGQDVAGVVDAVGADVTAWAVGDEVLGFGTRTYADYALADADRLAAKPAALSWELAGALPTAADAAYRALAEVKVGEGDTVLVHAAAGGVGGLAVQFAKLLGARVIGTASEANHEYLRELGAEPVTYGEGLADRVRALAPDGVDAAVDFVGGGVLAASVALAGGPERVMSIVDPHDAEANGVRFSSGHDGEDYLIAALTLASDLLVRGRLVLPLAGVLSLDEAAEAHRRIDSGRTRGKLVLLTD